MVKLANVNERTILHAIRQRSSFIKENATTLSMKALRALLEEDMEIPAQTLKRYKKFIEGKALQVLGGGAAEGSDQGEPDGSLDSEEENRPQKKKQRVRKSEKPAKRSAPAENDRKAAKKAKSKDKVKEKPAKRAKREPEDEDEEDEEDRPQSKAAGVKTHGSKVLNLQSICKRATIKIPPNTYRGDPSEQELADRIEALLDKHGLSRKAGEREIMKTKSRLQTERELEGIDTTNIMQGGMRARRAAAPTVDYRTLQGSSDSEDDQDSGSDHDSGSDSDAAPSDRGKGAKRQSESWASGDAAPSEAASDGMDAEHKESSGDQLREQPAAAAAAQRKASPRKRQTVLDDSSSEEANDDDDDAGSPADKRSKSEPAAEAVEKADSDRQASAAAADDSMALDSELVAEQDAATADDVGSPEAQQSDLAMQEQEMQPADQHGSDHSIGAENHKAGEDESDAVGVGKSHAPARRRAVLDESDDE